MPSRCSSPPMAISTSATSTPPNVYYFDAQGQLQGVIVAPPAIRPQREGKPAFGSLAPPQSGRRNNQGVEGMGLSPDGSRLFVAPAEHHAAGQRTRQCGRAHQHPRAGLRRDGLADAAATDRPLRDGLARLCARRQGQTGPHRRAERAARTGCPPLPAAGP
ncbi:esterase-like activity of phytase family protein [Stenotrophomonas sp. NRRL B-14846]|uniref:esterase-like activity of phytase family protein n=1 Tax=Stenotrophomonas sp. NRRL B-14846 TaxID=3162882 RepID=UPI003D287776